MSSNSIPLYRCVTFDSVRVEVKWCGRSDLDLACFLISSDKKCRSQFDYIGATSSDLPGEKIYSRCGSVVYHGDVLDGRGDGGARERISVFLKSLRPHVEKIVFFLFSGQEPFSVATQVELNIYNDESNVIYHANVPTDLCTAGDYFSRKIGTLVRTKKGWEIQTDGSMSEKTLEDYMLKYGIDPELYKFHDPLADWNKSE